MSTRRTLPKQIPANAFATKPPYIHAAQLTAPRQDDWPPYQIDLMDSLKTLTTFALRFVPEVGTILSLMAQLLWPAKPKADPWDQIRKKVEDLISQKINDAVFSLLKSKFRGLGKASKLYVQAVASKDPDTIRMQFIATNTVFVAAASEFQNPDYEWTLAPLFAIFAQLHVGLLRDAVLHGEGWGWNQTTYKDVVTQSNETIKDYVAYLDAATNHQKEKLALHAPTKPGQHQTDIHNYWQPFWQMQTLLIDDFRVLLIHMDPVEHPIPPERLPFKDVYSRAYGTADDWDRTCQAWSNHGVTTPYSAPLEGFTSIYIEVFNQTPRVVDVRYPQGKGPLVNNKERTDLCGIIATPLKGVETRTKDFPGATESRLFTVEKALIRGGSTPLALTLVLADGSQKWCWERSDIGGDAKVYEVAVPGRMISTLTMWSRSRFYNQDLGCIIFGFSRDPKHISDHLKESIYIGVIDQPNTGLHYLPRSISPDLQSRRDAYWTDIQSRQRP